MTAEPSDLILVDLPRGKTADVGKLFSDGLFTWTAPAEPLEPRIEFPHLIPRMMASPSTVIVHTHLKPPPLAAKLSVAAFERKPNQWSHLLCNRPDAIPAKHRGRIVRYNFEPLEPANYPMVTDADTLKPDSTITVFKVRSGVARYYRSLWVHSLANTVADQNYLIAVDGKVCGAMGFLLSAVRNFSTEYVDEWYGVSPTVKGLPYLNRLVMWVETCREFADMVVANTQPGAWRIVGVQTTYLTRHPNRSMARGILERVSCEERKGGGFKLRYRADFRAETLVQALDHYRRDLERFGVLPDRFAAQPATTDRTASQEAKLARKRARRAARRPQPPLDDGAHPGDMESDDADRNTDQTEA